jgi:hypothetical protein
MINRAAANCTLCDLHGYRPSGILCDHVDHRPAYDRGMALCRQALSKQPQIIDQPRALQLPLDGESNVC